MSSVVTFGRHRYILPEAFARDGDRLARFEREAKLPASLSHPNIASIYGVEEADGVKALVLELVEGPTLTERLEEGRIPVDETLAIAKQIAEALRARARSLESHVLALLRGSARSSSTRGAGAVSATSW